MLEKYKQQIRDIWWVKITKTSVEVESIYPDENEAYKALNVLVWYCVWKWMKVREYEDSDDLLYSMRWPIRELNSFLRLKKLILY